MSVEQKLAYGESEVKTLKSDLQAANDRVTMLTNQLNSNVRICLLISSFWKAFLFKIPLFKRDHVRIHHLIKKRPSKIKSYSNTACRIYTSIFSVFPGQTSEI